MKLLNGNFRKVDKEKPKKIIFVATHPRIRPAHGYLIAHERGNFKQVESEAKPLFEVVNYMNGHKNLGSIRFRKNNH